ncbi:MAG: hypothetical protein ACK5YW_02750 [Betaproteobacteria bacterium]|jgi:hypothetical protein|nr:hypothetical protein [Rhodocyclaceae bacterium]MCE2897816.1 hypothetical protein [Betaproteobacteria bacterium]
MSEFKVLAGFAIIAAVLVFWYRINRSLRGGGSGLDMTPQRRPREGGKGADGANELERFVAQHRSGVLPSPPGGGGGSSLTAASALPPPAVATAPSAAALLHAPVLLTGAEKLAFLAFKAALPDHHVLARVPLGQLLPGLVLESSLAAHAHAVVVCGSDFSVRAAVDVTTPAATVRLAAVRQTLEARAIRHLVLDQSKLPKPKEIRALLHV